jgi:hypothetical protein
MRGRFSWILIQRAQNGGKLYALCGLYMADRKAFEKVIGPFVSDGSMVEFNDGGLVTQPVAMEEVVFCSTGDMDVVHGGYPRSVLRLAREYVEQKSFNWDRR